MWQERVLSPAAYAASPRPNVPARLLLDVDMRAETAELSHSHPSRFLVTIGFVIVPFVIVLILVAAIWGVVSGDRYWVNTQGVIVLLTGLCMCYGLREWIRGRHAYRTTYVVGGAGVRIMELAKESQQIHWEEFSCGINKRLLPAVVLFSSHPEKPVVSFNKVMRGVSREYKQVRDLAVCKLGERMRTRWF